jgi:hypothetical protein
VLLCTEDLYEAPFLNGDSVASSHDTSNFTLPLITDGSEICHLHLDMFQISDPTLAFVRVPQNITTFRLFDFQALTIAGVFSGKAVLPTREEMESVYSQRTTTQGNLNTLGGSKELAYIGKIANWINTSDVLSAGEA